MHRASMFRSHQPPPPTTTTRNYLPVNQHEPFTTPAFSLHVAATPSSLSLKWRVPLNSPAKQ